MPDLTTRTMRLLHIIQDNTIIVFAALGAFLLPIQPLLLLVGMMIVMDTILGIWKAIKIKEKISSRKLSNVISKMILYQGTIITFYLIECYVLGEFVNLFIQIPHFLTKIMAVILVGVELTSAHENFEIITKINLWKTFKTLVKRGTEAKNDLVELTDLNTNDEELN